MNRTTPFSKCAQTSIHDPLLEAIVANKNENRLYPNINPVTRGGHTRTSLARHLLTYIIRSALGIYRLPGHSDLELNPKFFCDFDLSVIHSAIKDARRIYDFGQNEMRRISSTMKLTRGLRHPESSVAFTLASKLGFPLRLPFQTFAFFNHVTAPFSGEATLQLNAPIEWIWASEYTLSDLELSVTDEEIIVAVDSIDGCIDVTDTAISFSSSAELLELRGDKSLYSECLGMLFGETKIYNVASATYQPGCFEGLGRRIDRRLSTNGNVVVGRKVDFI